VTQPKAVPQPTLTGNCLHDYNRADTLKTEAAKLVSAKKFDEACDRYFKAVNIVRLND